MIDTTIDFESRWRRGALLALPAGFLAVTAATLQWLEAASVRILPLGHVIAAVGVLILAIGFELTRSRSHAGSPFDAPRLGLWLAAFALSVVSIAEQPLWPSIDTFGTALAIPYLAVLGLAGALAFDCALGPKRRVDSSLALLTLFAAFGGPLFLREGSLFHAYYGLLGVAAIGYALPAKSRADSPLHGWLTLGIASLIGLSVLPIATAMDRGQHLAGFVRVLIAFAPLPLIAAARDRAAAARTALFAFAFALLLGGLAAVFAVLEAASYVDLEHVLRARLSLFGEHPNIIAPYFAVGIPLAIAACFQTRSRLLKLALIAIAVLAFVALELTQSRASRAGGAIGILVVFGVGLSRLLTRHLDTPGKRVALVGVLLLLIAGGGFALRHKIQAKLVDPSMEFRVYMWQTAQSALADRPWLGFGFVSSEPLMSYAQPSDLDGRTKDTHPHMMLLSFALGAGVPGAILFALLMLGVALRAILLAARADDFATRFLAGGIAASLIALFLSNLLDQGLSLHAPIPLHFGLLLTLLCGALAGPETAGAAPTAVNPPTPLFACAGLLVALHCVQTLAADRLLGFARIETQRRNFTAACTLTSVARYVAPLQREVVLRHAEALDHSGDRQGAADVLAHATETFRMSPYPWERLANLEYDRRNWTSSLAALSRARERDPTGPNASQWSLRLGNIYANLGQRTEAIDELARAIRFDYEAAARAGWRLDENKEYFIPVVNSDSPIFLGTLLTANRSLLPDAVKNEPVYARRLATTLVKIALNFRRFEFARDVITQYKSLTSEPWLPLEHLENDLERQERLEAGKKTEVPTDTSPGDVAPPSSTTSTDAKVPAAAVMVAAGPKPGDDRFAGVAGHTVVYLDEGRSFAEAKDYRSALDSYRKGLVASYDIVAERQYIALVQDAIFDAALGLGDLALADTALEPNLYFHAQPADRLAIHRRLAQAQIAAADFAGAEGNLRRCGALLRLLSPSRSDESASDLGNVLGGLLDGKTTAETDLANRMLTEYETHGGGLLASMYAYRAASRLDLAERRSQQLRREFPEWLAGGHNKRAVR